MQKGDFLEFMPQMFPVGTTRPVLTEKVKTCSNFYNLFSRPKSGEHHLLAAKNRKSSKRVLGLYILLQNGDWCITLIVQSNGLTKCQLTYSNSYLIIVNFGTPPLCLGL